MQWRLSLWLNSSFWSLRLEVKCGLAKFSADESIQIKIKNVKALPTEFFLSFNQSSTNLNSVTIGIEPGKQKSDHCNT